MAQLTEDVSARDALQNEKKRNYKVVINENGFVHLFFVFLPKLKNKNIENNLGLFCVFYFLKLVFSKTIF